MKKINKNLPYTGICGQFKELLYDKKISKLNVELAEDKIGAPILIFEDWSVKNKSRELFRMHIKEAMELKAIIDQLVFDYSEYHTEDMINEHGE